MGLSRAGAFGFFRSSTLLLHATIDITLRLKRTALDTVAVLMKDRDRLSMPPGFDPTRRGSNASTDHAGWAALFSAWLIALVSTLGALFLGEVMGRPPCVLCWYQRIAMFPLAIILGLALLPLDLRSIRYALPLAVTGWAVALYHCLLYWEVVPKGLVPCGQGASCTEGQLALVGLLSIPLLSLMAFSLIVVLLVVAMKGVPK